MTTINDVFKIIQGHQITDEELYNTMGDIPVLTGRNETKGYWDCSLVKESDLPCITYSTKGNTNGDAFVQTRIFDANNTAVLILKPEWRSKVHLEWFVFKLRHILPEIQTSKEGVSYLNKAIVQEYEIGVPDKFVQERELQQYKRLQGYRNAASCVIEEVDHLFAKKVFSAIVPRTFERKF